MKYDKYISSKVTRLNKPLINYNQNEILGALENVAIKVKVNKEPIIGEENNNDNKEKENTQ